jgi:Ser/Thr protein kinase RdoA (MazF antagonist)
VRLPPSAIAVLAGEYPQAAPVLLAATPTRLDGGEESAAYQLGQYVVRVGAPWRSSAELEWSGRVAAATALQVPEAIAPVRSHKGSTVHVVEGCPLTMWPFVSGTAAKRSNGRHVDAAADLLARVHRALAGASLPLPPGSDRLPGDTSDLADRALDEWLRAFEGNHQRRHGLHGDYYPGNVLAAGDKLVGLLDWDEAVIGMAESELATAAWEWGDCLQTGLLDRAGAFVASYSRAGGTAESLDESALRQLIRQRLRREVGLRRSDRTGEPPDPDDNDYTAAQVAAFHDLAPK